MKSEYFKKQYQYIVDEIDYTDEVEFKMRLNFAGDRGWELVNVKWIELRVSDKICYKTICTFKREKLKAPPGEE
ncbi:hypothetical protein [Parabacteroides sp. PF5-9]|uniref:hypothetical protein n=1 Tax=Parabacteroides sp. PF5-9 TaxID=1742404 RepID=UPI00247579A3|nr:hypothetical protein [Parabacteroides sp. PF5-9]MDH6356964.1 hypothetical protein [Parabacteroides sp. PF5-9]